jgi:hypothetical protein
MPIAHGDPFTLIIMLIVEGLRAAADNAGPILAVLLKLIGVLLVLPLLVLLVDLLCGIVTAIFVRKKRWLFVIVSLEALVLYGFFCLPAALFLVSDWHPLWAWLTIGLGGVISMLTGLVNSSLLVAILALVARLFTKKTVAPLPDKAS